MSRRLDFAARLAVVLVLTALGGLAIDGAQVRTDRPAARPSPVPDAPDAPADACPLCGSRLGAAAEPPCPCAAKCGGKCVFPGQCGDKACTCKPRVGVVPPTQDQWRVFAANPAYEVFGHEVPETRDGKAVMVFRYRFRRLHNRTATQLPAAAAR